MNKYLKGLKNYNLKEGLKMVIRKSMSIIRDIFHIALGIISLYIIAMAFTYFSIIIS